MALLRDLRVVQLGEGSASAVCGSWFAASGASVVATGTHGSASSLFKLNKTFCGDIAKAIVSADLIVCEGTPHDLVALQHDAPSLRRQNSTTTIALISPYGQTGPRANQPATDLTLACASGIARLLTGQVDDVSEPPIRPVGQQSAVIGGLAAACAAMAVIAGRQQGITIDVSIQEALATLGAGELAKGGLTASGWSRQRMMDGNGATVTILPARDGYVAVSPREEAQWTRWIAVMGAPSWSSEARFARKADRVANWDELFALMSDWSMQHGKQWIADQAQSAHVPSFPLGELSEHLDSDQLRHRDFFRRVNIEGREINAPGTPYRLQFVHAKQPLASECVEPHPSKGKPLEGVRILDFSWVIAGPTTTRHLAALGAEVIKVEAPGAGDPARQSHLHTVLGQGKKSIVLDLKKQPAINIAKSLVARCDILIENFATGVMARLGLDRETLKAANPNLIYISASGLGRTGPSADKVAYGTLLQSYAGFAGLNRHPDREPRVGFAWLDPMCGLMLPYIASAALWQRKQTGSKGVHIDFSMLEAMLWTLSEPILATQLGDAPRPEGNHSNEMAPHNVYACAGEDRWIAVAVENDASWRRLCGLVPGLAGFSEFNLGERFAQRATIDEILTAWTRGSSVTELAAMLVDTQIASASVVGTRDLIEDAHLKARGFWDVSGDGVVPGLPWHANFSRTIGAAPGMGADTDWVLKEILKMPAEKIAYMRASGAIG